MIFNNFIDVANLFDKIKSNKIILTDAEKNQMDFNSKLSDMIKKKPNEQQSEIENIMSLSDTQSLKQVIKCYKHDA